MGVQGMIRKLRMRPDSLLFMMKGMIQRWIIINVSRKFINVVMPQRIIMFFVYHSG